MRAQFQAGGAPDANVDRNLLREQVRQQVAAIFEKHLTPEQFKQYQQISRQASETRAGQIWLQSKDGEVEPVAVRFGISDDNYTQIIGQGIKAGDQVVTRVRDVSK